MSQMGQSRRFAPLPATSGLPRTTDIITSAGLVRFVPNADIKQLKKPAVLAGALEVEELFGQRQVAGLGAQLAKRLPAPVSAHTGAFDLVGRIRSSRPRSASLGCHRAILNERRGARRPRHHRRRACRRRRSRWSRRRCPGRPL
jgi:hypothetical protein